MNMDEKHPTSTPTISGSTNSLIAGPVIMYSGIITTRVVTDVMMDVQSGNTAHVLLVLSDPVEYNDGVVYGISDHSEYSGDERVVYRDAEYKIERQKQQAVVGQRDDCRDSEFPF